MESTRLWQAGFATLVLLMAGVPAQAETLPEAVVLSLNNHPKVEQAKAERAAANASETGEFAGYFPDVSVNATSGRVFADNTTTRGLSVTRGTGYSWMHEGSVALVQPLFDGFETPNRVKAAKARSEGAAYNIVDVRESLALDVTKTYLEVIKLRESLSMLKDYKAKLADYRHRINIMLENGAADENLLLRAQDIEMDLSNVITETEGKLTAQNARYAELVGHVPDEGMIKPLPKLEVIPAEESIAVSVALENHPLLQEIAREEKATAAEAKAEKQFYFPDLSGELSYLERDQRDLIGGEVRDAKALLRLRWDINVGGAEVAKAREAKQTYYQTQARRRDAERQIERDVRVAWSDMITAQRKLEFLNERKNLNARLFETTKTQFEGARVNLLQLMQVDNAYFKARLNLLHGEYGLLVGQYTLLANIGHLQDALNIVPVNDDE